MHRDPLQNTLSGYRIVLGSQSPRRKELLEQMGLPFEIRPLPVEEQFPKPLEGAAIPDFLARHKADAHREALKPDELLITADTIVWHEGRLLGKPASRVDACGMLQALSGDWHEVITAVCCTTTKGQRCRHETTLVKFRKLGEDEIAYYVDRFKPFDKAGAYGIQEWIGLVGIEEISGSYTNVVGLPTQLAYTLLKEVAAMI